VYSPDGKKFDGTDASSLHGSLVMEAVKKLMDNIPILFHLGGLSYMLLVWLSSKHKTPVFAKIGSIIILVLVLIAKFIMPFLYGRDLVSMLEQLKTLDPLKQQVEYDELLKNISEITNQVWDIQIAIYYTVIILTVLGTMSMLSVVIKNRGKIFVYKGLF